MTHQPSDGTTVTPLANEPTAVHPFAKLYGINVNEYVEKKGGFSYLSWPYAVAQLRLADPSATWEVKRFDGLPYLATEAGVFVEVAVTYAGVTLSQIHPVLDGRNRPIMVPNSFEINTSIQRCLVKAIALHGLGLYIFAGEDLPQTQQEAANDPKQPLEPSKQAWVGNPMLRTQSGSEGLKFPNRSQSECISRSQQVYIQKLAVEIGISLEQVLSYFGVAQLADIAATEFLRVVRSLEKRRQAA